LKGLRTVQNLASDSIGSFENILLYACFVTKPPRGKRNLQEMHTRKVKR
jgi:hypothetical protein